MKQMRTDYRLTTHTTIQVIVAVCWNTHLSVHWSNSVLYFI